MQGREKTTIQVVMAANTCRRKDLDSIKPSQKSQSSSVVEKPSPNRDILKNGSQRGMWSDLATTSKTWSYQDSTASVNQHFMPNLPTEIQLLRYCQALLPLPAWTCFTSIIYSCFSSKAMFCSALWKANHPKAWPDLLTIYLDISQLHPQQSTPWSNSRLKIECAASYNPIEWLGPVTQALLVALRKKTLHPLSHPQQSAWSLRTFAKVSSVQFWVGLRLLCLPKALGFFPLTSLVCSLFIPSCWTARWISFVLFHMSLWVSIKKLLHGIPQHLMVCFLPFPYNSSL